MLAHMDRRMSLLLGTLAASAHVFLTACASAPSRNAQAVSAPVAVFDGHSDFAIHYAYTKPPWSLSAHDFAVKLPGQSDLPRWRALIGGAANEPLWERRLAGCASAPGTWKDSGRKPR